MPADLIARGGQMVTLEGSAEIRRVVIIEVPNLDQTKAFYHCAEYAEAKKPRAGVARGSSWRLKAWRPPADLARRAKLCPRLGKLLVGGQGVALRAF